MLNSLFGTLTSECWTLNSEISCISIINHVSVDSHMAQALCFLLARSLTSPWHPWRFVSGCPGKGDHWVPRGRMESFHTLERLPARALESFLECLEKNVQQAGTQLCTSWVKMRRSGEIRSENPQSRWNSAVKSAGASFDVACSKLGSLVIR